MGGMGFFFFKNGAEEEVGRGGPTVLDPSSTYTAALLFFSCGSDLLSLGPHGSIQPNGLDSSPVDLSP